MKVDLTLLEQIVSPGKAPAGGGNNLDAGEFAALLKQALADVIDDSGLSPDGNDKGAPGNGEEMALFIEQLTVDNEQIAELLADIGNGEPVDKTKAQTINDQFMFALEMLAGHQKAEVAMSREGSIDPSFQQEKVTAAVADNNPGEKEKGFAGRVSPEAAVNPDSDPGQIRAGDKKTGSPPEDGLKSQRDLASRITGDADENQALKGRFNLDSPEKTPVSDKPAARPAGSEVVNPENKELAGQAKQAATEKAAVGGDQLSSKTGQNGRSVTASHDAPAGKSAGIYQDKSLEAQNELSAKMTRAETVSVKPQVNNAPAEQPHLNQQPSIQADHAVRAEAVLQSQDSSSLRQSVMQQLEGKLVYLRESANNPAEMRLTLNPPELGEVTIRVFSRQGKLSASIVAETQLVKEIIESSISELRQRMNFVGIQFEQLDVSTSDGYSGESDRSDGNFGAAKPNSSDSPGGELVSEENSSGSPALVSGMGDRIIDYLA